MWEIPRTEQTSNQTAEVNWAPMSEVRRAGTPNLVTQVEMKAREQDSVVMEDSETASGHLEVLSIMVRIYEYPWLEGRGPTKSRWT